MACATPPAALDSPTPAELMPATPPSPDVEAQKPSDCMTACVRQNMARAVSAETIEADCVRSCENTARNPDAVPSL